MKKTWMEPQIEVQQFMANEYVAACHDMNRVYKFECKAPAGTLYYYPDSDPSTTDTFTAVGTARRLGSYHPCNASHEASTQNDFYYGFVDYDEDREPDTNEQVIVWRGPSGNNGHANASVNMTEWETAKS